MKLLLKTQIFILLALFSINSFGQFSLSGEFRPRTEFSHGYKSLASPDQEASLFTAQRTRLNFDYKNDLYKVKLTLQDVRAWGSQKQLVSNEDFATSVHEAWAEVFFTEKISLKAGRQELVYDDHRIFGSVGWANQARSHDVALLKFKLDCDVHIGFAYNENTNRTNNFYDGPDAYKAMQFFHWNRKFEKLSASILFLNNGKAFADEVDSLGNVTAQGVQYSQTIGARLAYKAGKLGVAGYFYYQMGKDGTDTELSAYDAALDLSYGVSDNLSFDAGFELLSGDDGTDDKNNSFTPFYGTNHKFNGFMDYFYVGQPGGFGLQDIYLKGKYKHGKMFFALHAHLLSTAVDISEDFDKGLGTEIDFFCGYNLSKQANIKLGYSQMLGTESMEAIRGGSMDETSNWAWLMLTVKPTFFKSE
jgi:hypothetical protein